MSRVSMFWQTFLAFGSLIVLSLGLGLAKPTVHGLLRTLEAHELVAQDPDTGKYSLGPGVLQLGNAYLDGSDLRARSLRELGGSCVGVVGHEPDLGVFAAWLIGSKKAQIKLSKGGAADVTFPDDLRRGAGVLVWLLTSDWIEEPPTQAGA